MVRRPKIGDAWLDVSDESNFGSPCVMVLVDRVPSRSVPGEFTWIALTTNSRGELECKRLADVLMNYWYSLGAEIGGKVILLTK